MKFQTDVIILAFLVIIFLTLGIYSAINDYGYIALLSGIFSGKAATHLYIKLKKPSEVKA